MKTVTDRRTIMVKKPQKVTKVIVRRQKVMRPRYRLVRKTESVKKIVNRR